MKHDSSTNETDGHWLWLSLVVEEALEAIYVEINFTICLIRRLCVFLSGSYSYVEGVATRYLINFVEFLVVLSDLSQSHSTAKGYLFRCCTWK